jgi:coiled-coil domain-containing protein, putative
MINLFRFLIYSFVFDLYHFLFNSDYNSTSYADEFTIRNKEHFEKLLSIKRFEQSQAIKSLISLKKYEQKHDIIKTMYEKLIETSIKARSQIEANAFIPNTLSDSNFKDHQSSLKLILTIVENCGFMSEIVLKLPDVSERLLKNYNHWMVMVHWCIAFSNSTGLLDKNTAQLFHLTAQQLNMIPKEDTFVNPYSKLDENYLINHTYHSKVKQEEKRLIKKHKREPRLSKKTEL